MKRILIILPIIATVAASPAFAAGGACASGPKADWKPQSALKKQLKAEGMTIRRIKEEGGCYEVYAVDKAGKRINVAFNAKTLKKVANAEAGEN